MLILTRSEFHSLEGTSQVIANISDTRNYCNLRIWDGVQQLGYEVNNH